MNDITPINNQLSPVSNQPSYMQLRNLASQVIQPQKKEENIAPYEPTEYIANQKEQRHFNQRYFQSINTHPNHIYNGLYKNTSGKASLHFKNTAENQKFPISDFRKSDPSSHITNEPEKTNVSPSIDSVPENVNTSAPTPVEAKSENLTTPAPTPVEAKSENLTTPAPTPVEAKSENLTTPAPTPVEAKSENITTPAPTCHVEAKSENLTTPASTLHC